MLNQQQHRERLRKETENMLFDAELAREIERQINAKKSGGTLAEKLGVEGPGAGVTRPQRFTVAGDDEK